MSDYKIELNGQEVWVELDGGDIYDIVDSNGESINPTDDQVYDAYIAIEKQDRHDREQQEIVDMRYDYGFSY